MPTAQHLSVKLRRPHLISPWNLCVLESGSIPSFAHWRHYPVLSLRDRRQSLTAYRWSGEPHCPLGEKSAKNSFF